jgi:hypothetical protein
MQFSSRPDWELALNHVVEVRVCSVDRAIYKQIKATFHVACCVCAPTGEQDVHESCFVRGIGEVSPEDCPLNFTLTQPCNTMACDFSIRVQNYTDCDDNCGTAYMYQSLQCISPLGFLQPLDVCATDALQYNTDTALYLSTFNRSGLVPWNATVPSLLPVTISGPDVTIKWPTKPTDTTLVLKTCATNTCGEIRCVLSL